MVPRKITYLKTKSCRFTNCQYVNFEMQCLFKVTHNGRVLPMVGNLYSSARNCCLAF